MYKYGKANKRLDGMQTQTQEYFWEPCINVVRKSTVDIEVSDNWAESVFTVKLTREDLESMLSALDDLEDTDD